MVYHEVLEDQDKVKVAIDETKNGFDSGSSINSIVRLLSLINPVSLTDTQDSESNPILQLILAEIGELKKQIRIPELTSDLSRTNSYMDHTMQVEKFRVDIHSMAKLMNHFRDRGVRDGSYSEELSDLSNRIYDYRTENKLELSESSLSELMGFQNDLASMRNQYMSHVGSLETTD